MKYVYFLSDETPKKELPYCPLDIQKDLYPFDGCECEILNNTMVYDKKDNKYPQEWTYDTENKPICTKFEEIE